MGSLYTSQATSGYNSNPPADDGSAVSSNQVKWATIKTKLSDVLKTFAEAINAQNVSFAGKTLSGAGVSTTGVNYSVVNTDQGKLIRATASSITITFPDATSVGSPFAFGILNSSSGTITIAGASAQTINGSSSLVMASNDGYIAFTDGSNWFVTGRKTGVLPRGYIDGCILSNAAGDTTNDIAIAAGVCRDSTNSVDITVAAFATGKQLDANWAPGDAAGMRNSGAGIANTTYHIYAVAKADNTQDIYAHTSTTVSTVITALQAETGGSAYIYARRIGSIIRSAGAIVGFVQFGDRFRLKSPDANAYTNPGTSAVSRTVLVPTGIVVMADIGIGWFPGSNAAQILLTALDETDTAPGVNNFTIKVGPTSGSTGCPTFVKTDTNGQFRTRASASGVADVMQIDSHGWIEPRGKDS